MLAAIMAALATVSIAALLRAILASRELRQRIAALTLAAQHFAAGGIAHTQDLGRKDQIGTLARALNGMAEELQLRIRAAEGERERLAVVLSNMAEGAIITDQEGIVQLVNHAAERLLDLPEDRAVGRSLMAVVRSHETAAAVRTSLEQREGEQEPRLVELGPPSLRRIVQIVVSRIPSDPPQVLVALHDVTELQHAATVRRDFVANVSHELRTPVAALKALVETLAGGALDDPEIARDFLSRMQVEADQLAELVEDLLELSRVEAGQLDVRPVPVDLATVTATAAERLRPLAERLGVLLDVRSIPGTTALADPVRTGQVVTNLVHNAVKFTPPGGRVTVTTGPHPDGIAVIVQDTGTGIPPEAMARVFERFYKADRARAGGGTGLGLAIAKHFVQAEGGRIWAESAGTGLGATFGFVLPTAETASHLGARP